MLNINYETDLNQFAMIQAYDLFRWQGDLYMKLPDLDLFRKVYINGFEHPEQFEFRKVNYNAIKLNVLDADNAYHSFAPSCKVQMLDCELLIKD